jgi:hypothetical protein
VKKNGRKIKKYYFWKKTLITGGLCRHKISLKLTDGLGRRKITKLKKKTYNNNSLSFFSLFSHKSLTTPTHSLFSHHQLIHHVISLKSQLSHNTNSLSFLSEQQHKKQISHKNNFTHFLSQQQITTTTSSPSPNL